MKILLTNDDGIHAPGLWHLWEAIRAGHEVMVVAPTREQSGVSHAFTLHQPIKIAQFSLDSRRSGWSVDGTPSDCVKIAITKILDHRPDLVIAGINAGDNTGVSHFYSGTVGAAREAALWGIASMAASVAIVDKSQFKFAAKFLAANLEGLAGFHARQPIYLNINFPHIAVEKIKGVRITQQGCAMFEDNYEERKDPRGRNYFWIYGEKPKEKFEPDSDDQATHNGYIAVTPFSVNATHQETRKLLEKEFKPVL